MAWKLFFLKTFTLVLKVEGIFDCEGGRVVSEPDYKYYDGYIIAKYDCEIGTRIVRITDKITTEQILEFYEKQEEECKVRQSQSLPCVDYYGMPEVPVKCK